MSTEFKHAGWATEGFGRPSPSKLAVLFRRVQEKNNFKSTAQGRPVFEEKIYITKIPADQFLKIDREATAADFEEFRAEYDQFIKTGESRVLGTPLDMWHAITETQRAEFKAAGLVTIEQVANMSDAMLQRYMGGGDLRQKARVFVESGKDAEFVAKIKAEANAEIEALKAQMAEMKAMLEAATAPAGKR